MKLLLISNNNTEPSAEIIRYSAENKAPILVATTDRRRQYLEAAEKLGVDTLPLPLTLADAKVPGVKLPHQVCVEHVDGALYDLLRRDYGIECAAATITFDQLFGDELKLTIDDMCQYTINVKYHDPDLIRLKPCIIGDWIDLRAAEDVTMKAGEYRLISLGVSMKMPPDMEAHIVPRSSTFKNWGILQTNSMGVIDNSYSGTNDVWMFPAYATRDTEIKRNDRICQFRIMPRMLGVKLNEVDSLDGKDRGGFGSTGTN